MKIMVKDERERLHDIYIGEGFLYDHGKRMYYKSRSVCCDSEYDHTLQSNKPWNKLNAKDKSNARFLPICSECNELCETTWEFRNI